MADAGARRHHAEIVKGPLPPFQEGVALAIPAIFHLDVFLERPRRGKIIHHHRVVDHKVNRRQRIDLGGVLSQILHCVAHRCQIDNGGNPGEILHQHAGRAESDFHLVLPAVLEPVGNALDVGLGDAAPILVAQQVFQQHFQRIGKF